ncbi:hypothetical protein HN865_00815 [Candidatus Woesearchaeota archaeon]|jgi:hypothetical protein|nr:hypothetical protein [Candidatus Woesearchaeota archaeon]MBT7237380.1 hypothetical protein [Candidatus Woesearchaeota archaeon]
MVINFLSREMAFDALDVVMYLRGKGGSEETYHRFVSNLEEGLERIENGEMGPISNSVIYDAVYAAYPFIKPYSDQMQLSLVKDIPNRLRNHLIWKDYNQEEIDNLTNFCKTFHDISLERRSENVPRIEEYLGELE